MSDEFQTNFPNRVESELELCMFLTRMCEEEEGEEGEEDGGGSEEQRGGLNKCQG